MDLFAFLCISEHFESIDKHFLFKNFREREGSEATENANARHEVQESKATENVSAKHEARGSGTTKYARVKHEA